MPSERLFHGQAVEIEIGGIKCDATGCTFTDPSVALRDYEQWLDRPCPACGANLLTVEDYKLTLALVGIVASANAEAPVPPPGSKRMRITPVMNGSGEVVRIKESHDAK